MKKFDWFLFILTLCLFIGTIALTFIATYDNGYRAGIEAIAKDKELYEKHVKIEKLKDELVKLRGYSGD